MSKPKFTPGPWTAYKFSSDWWVGNASDDSGPMLRVGSWYDEREANANLIAAAPDLYAACAEFVRKVESGAARSTRSYEQMLAALAKARGEAE